MKLLTPFSLAETEFPNRLVMSPMCMYSAENGFANDFHFVHYVTRAMGGVGLIMLEATGVTPEGRITPKCLGIWSDAHIESLKKIVNHIHNQTSSKVGIQLAHAGRKASTWNNEPLPKEEAWEILAPSAVPYRPKDIVPKEMSAEDITKLIDDFRSAALRAVEAGFDVVEIHAAHGYLLHQFLSPLSNHRQDAYGSSFENRIRLLREVCTAVKEVLPNNRALFVRISATDYSEGGWDLSQSIELSKILKSLGVDLIDVSSGGNVHNVKITLFDGYQVGFSEEIKHKANIATGAVGLITDADTAEEILQKEQADLIFMGRELLRNPYFLLDVKDGENKNPAIPKQYSRAFR